MREFMIDISRPLRNGFPAWPGDTEFSFNLTWTREQSGSVNVGRLVMSTHTGTHVDAPFHFTDDGRKVSEMDLSVFAGPARLIEVRKRGGISADELAEHDLSGVSRLLIRTGSWPLSGPFPEEFRYLLPDAARIWRKRASCLSGSILPRWILWRARSFQRTTRSSLVASTSSKDSRSMG